MPNEWGLRHIVKANEHYSTHMYLLIRYDTLAIHFSVAPMWQYILAVFAESSRLEEINYQPCAPLVTDWTKA